MSLPIKDHHQVAMLLGAGAVALLVYLYKFSPRAAAVGPAQPENTAAVVSSSAPQYPNAQPLAPVDMGGASGSGGDSPPPSNLSYNQPSQGGGQIPTVSVLPLPATGSCGCQDSCIAAGQVVSVNRIPAPIYQAAATNLASFQTKVAPPRGMTLGLPASF